MGYYTAFSLELKTASGNNLFSHPDPDPIIAELRGENKEAEYCLDVDGLTEETGKWYDVDSDMKAFSLKHPDVVFVMSGEGEESGDMWTNYFHNGKMQECRVKISYPPYDPSELR